MHRWLDSGSRLNGSGSYQLYHGQPACSQCWLVYEWWHTLRAAFKSVRGQPHSNEPLDSMPNCQECTATIPDAAGRLLGCPEPHSWSPIVRGPRELPETAHLHLRMEAVQAGAGGALMVAPQQGDVLRHGQLPGSQQDEDLQAPSASVHKVPCCGAQPSARAAADGLHAAEGPAAAKCAADGSCSWQQSADSNRTREAQACRHDKLCATGRPSCGHEEGGTTAGSTHR